MKKEKQVDDFVEKSLDRINFAGEWVGKILGSFGRTTQKVLIGSVILVVFGLVAFLWAMANGMRKKG